MTDLEDRDRRRRADDLFSAALELSEGERPAWLDAQCAGDAELRAEVDELLRAHALDDGILEHDVPVGPRDVAAGGQPEAPRGAAAGRSETEPRRVGHYRVLRELGRGGMGVVYLGERDDGQFRRQVAIKLLRGASEGEDLRERFQTERHILASLDHPNIARLLDAGVTDGQLPYLVMEYVDGLPITVYCDRHRLGIEARLRLFQDVCAAVHHAHRNLVLHRDLKPGNILVTEQRQVKLLDFGIAKLLNPGISALATPITRTGARVLTPEYASPEQLRGEPLSTASDVYALGVVLYELLAGCRPDQVAEDQGAETSPPARFAEREPPRPSTVAAARLALAADARDTTTERLRKTLHGDLDAIVLMALRAESDRRYGSADLLMEDVHRHLEGLPVLAHRGSRRYYVGKFMRLHRAAVTVALVAGASLVTGAGAALWQASIARAERDRAEAARGRAEQALGESEAVTSYLVGLFEASDPAESPGEVTARDLLRRGAARVEALSGQPLVQAKVLDAVAEVYLSIGKPANARPLVERALAVRRARLGDRDLDVARTLVLLADVLRRQGLYPEAEARSREALQIQEGLLGERDPAVARTLTQISGLAIYGGDFDTAERLARRALAINEQEPEPNDSLVAASLIHLAAVVRRIGGYEEGEAALRRAVALSERAYGPEHAMVAAPLRHLAYLVADLGRLDEAESLLRRVLRIRRRSVGPTHPEYAYILGDLADISARRGDHARATELFREELGLLRRTYGPEYADVAPLLGRISVELAEIDSLDAAEAAVGAALAIARRDWGEDHQAFADLLMGRAEIHRRSRRWDAAERDMRRAIDIRSRANGPDTRNVGIMRAALGSLLLEQGRLDLAEAELTAALRVLRASRTPDQDPRLQTVRRDLASIAAARQR